MDWEAGDTVGEGLGVRLDDAPFVLTPLLLLFCKLLNIFVACISMFGDLSEAFCVAEITLSSDNT